MNTQAYRNTALAIVTAVIVGGLSLGIMFAHADVAPIIITTIRNVNSAPITSAAIGASVRSAVTVASSTNPTPTGTVDFNLYSNTSCTGTPTTQTGVVLVDGSATSSATTVGAAGLSYKIHYNGEATNVAANGVCAPLTATASAVAIATTLSTTTSVLPGSFVSDSAILSNATANAGGTVTYSAYTNNLCNAGAQSAGAFTVTNGIVPNSSSLQFNSVGTYYWQAVYSGDANNSAATSTCGSEILTVAAPVVVPNTVTIATSLSTTTALVGNPVHDSAILSGKTANAGGTVAYSVYSNNACSAGRQGAGQKTVTNGVVPDSDTLVLTAGTYYWQAVYSGDANNTIATSTCGAEIVTITAAPVPPVQDNAISGQVYGDVNKNAAKDAGETGLSGWTINLYASANFANGAYDPIFKTAVTDASGNYSFTGLANGTYSVEQVVMSDWNQTTDDFASVAVSGGVAKTGLDFGDASSTKARGHGHFNFHHDWKKFLKNFKNDHDNGIHRGHGKSESDDGDNDNENDDDDD